MAQGYLNTLVTPAVSEAQAHYYGYAMATGGAVSTDPLGEDERGFIESRDSFYMATVSENGWPYIQHRGGRRGFLRVVSRTQLAFADYKGNRQMLSTGNLAANAHRYASTLNIEAHRAAKSITLVFDDDGPGIPEASREDVFKPFYRLDEARNLNASGTGLGLSIVRDIARSHGGDVTLDDSPLGGLRVIVKIPA